MIEEGELREHIFSVAYRMLGSVADAEDIVQDTWVRWLRRSDSSDVESPRAFLTTTAARLAIDRLRTLKRQRAAYEGTWLPEPIISEGPEARTSLATSLSPAFLVVLETLSAIERAAFLLRDVFELDYSDIAEVIEKSESNARQICKRARDRVHAGPRFEASASEADALALQFFTAAATGSLDDLVSLLQDDIVAWTDHGGKARAAKNTITGRDNVARYLIGAASKFAADLEPVFARVNGVPGVVLYDGNRASSVLFIEITRGRVARFGTIRNPDKLARLHRNL